MPAKSPSKRKWWQRPIVWLTTILVGAAGVYVTDAVVSGMKSVAPDVDQTVRSADPASLENLPIGLDGATYQWIDLDNEGLPGILTERAHAWCYKRNWSNQTWPLIAPPFGGRRLHVCPPIGRTHHRATEPPSARDGQNASQS